MSLTINYDSNFSSFSYNGDSGLMAYLSYFQDSFSSTGHASSLGFHDGPGAALDVWDESYAATYFGTPVVGNHLSSTSATVNNVSFLVEGQSVDLEDDNNNITSSDDIIYTGGTNPGHTLAGSIDLLTFGNGAYSSGSLASDLFSIDGLAESIGTGFLDTNDVNGVYDAIDDTAGNQVHNLIYDLMGGMGGAGGTSVLEDILNDFDIVHEGTSADETFDVFAGVDTINLGGGDDVVSTGFTVGSGGDVIDLSDMSHYFADAADVASQVTYSGGNAYLEYYDGVDLYSVEIVGVASGLTADNFVV